MAFAGRRRRWDGGKKSLVNNNLKDKNKKNTPHNILTGTLKHVFFCLFFLQSDLGIFDKLGLLSGVLCPQLPLDGTIVLQLACCLSSGSSQLPPSWCAKIWLRLWLTLMFSRAPLNQTSYGVHSRLRTQNLERKLKKKKSKKQKTLKQLFNLASLTKIKKATRQYCITTRVWGCWKLISGLHFWQAFDRLLFEVTELL